MQCISVMNVINEGLIQEIYRNDDIEIIYNEIAQGQVFKGHSHEESQIVYVVGGEFIFVVADENLQVSKGDVRTAGCNVSHSAIATCDFQSIDVKCKGESVVYKESKKDDKNKEIVTNNITIKHIFDVCDGKIVLRKDEILLPIKGIFIADDVLENKKMYKCNDDELEVNIEQFDIEYLIFQLN